MQWAFFRSKNHSISRGHHGEWAEDHLHHLPNETTSHPWVALWGEGSTAFGYEKKLGVRPDPLPRMEAERLETFSRLKGLTALTDWKRQQFMTYLNFISNLRPISLWKYLEPAAFTSNLSHHLGVLSSRFREVWRGAPADDGRGRWDPRWGPVSLVDWWWSGRSGRSDRLNLLFDRFAMIFSRVFFNHLISWYELFKHFTCISCRLKVIWHEEIPWVCFRWCAFHSSGVTFAIFCICICSKKCLLLNPHVLHREQTWNLPRLSGGRPVPAVTTR